MKQKIILGIGLLLATTVQAEAGWQSVFQVTCYGHSAPAVSSYPSVSAYADPCNPCPQQVCTTRYIQKSYYQPVTSYQTRTYYEPVTTYRTSYYYEPVTSYRRTCYYDPCTCSYRSACVPVTSYRLRSQCCPVQTWVQRCCSVPVTTYRQCYYWEPQTTCAYVDPCAPTRANAPVVTENPPVPPAVTENASPPAVPRVQEHRDNGTGSNLYDQYNRPAVPANPNSLDGRHNSFRYPPQYPPQPPAAKPTQPFTVKPEYITKRDEFSAPSVRLTGVLLPQ